MNSGQSAALNLSNEQLQVILTGKFGDGNIYTPRSCKNTSVYKTCCMYEEYIDFKIKLLGGLVSNKCYTETNGYAGNPIWSFYTHANENINIIQNMNIEDTLNLMDDLGLALWFYDDGSLHKTKLFYNLNTQAYSEEINRDVFVPFLKKFNIQAVPTIERKKDGREFWYLRISKYDGAYEISKILKKYPVSCYNYKIWSSETIQNWSKLQEWLKRNGGLDFSNRKKSSIFKKIENGEL